MIGSIFSSTIKRPAFAEDWADIPGAFLHNPVATILFEEATWRIFTANPAACGLYEYNSSEFSGMSLLDLVKQPASGSFGPTNFEMKAMFLGRAEPWAHRRKDGREILVETTSHVTTWNGRSVQILFVVDKTESMLAQRRLSEVLSKAEAALHARNEFLSTVSHELRTPMNGVIGMAGLLTETELTDEQREAVGAIRSCAELLLTTVDDILDFSKSERNELFLQMLDFDLPTMLDDLVDIVEASAHQKGITIRTSIAPATPTNLVGDGGRLRQVLMNLLRNAVKFTERGSIRLSVRLAGSAKQPKLLFEVQDTGIGISAETQARLFQAFGQADSSITRRYGGTGLGLAIAKRLVTMMDGEMGVKSQEGEGSTFWFTAHFLPGSRHARVEHKVELLKGAEVLLVQKDPKERAAARALLEEAGMQVSEAWSAPEALSLCSSRAPGQPGFAFCLVDAKLPVIEGMEFVRILRAERFGADTRIVLMVERHSPETTAEAKRIGISGLLVKPLRRKQLIGALSRAQAVPKNLTIDASAPEGHGGGAAAILLVEDNIVNQKVASNSLAKLGYTVEVASNGAQAIEAFQRRPFDLILMDCHMPVMDGYTATERIRSSGVSGRYVPIIAMTADVVESQRQRCIASGMNDFLFKPVRREVLGDMLEHWLAQCAVRVDSPARVKPQ